MLLQVSIEYLLGWVRHLSAIDDQMEEGIPEADAVASLGSVVAVAEQILLDMPLPKLVKARVKPKRRLRAWEIVLIIVGSPVWFPILLALAAVALAVYVVLWSLVVSIYAVDVALAACLLGGLGGGVGLFITGNPFSALFLLGAGLVCGGLSIFLFFGCKAATKGTVLLTRKMLIGVKKCFVRKESV